MEQQDKIKQYLRDQLSDEAAVAFRREMAADPQLADQVRSAKQLMLLEELELREKIRGYLEDGKKIPGPVRTPKWIVLGLIIVLSVLLSIIIWWRRPATPAVFVPTPPVNIPPVSAPPVAPIDTTTAKEPPIAMQQLPQRLSLDKNDLQWLSDQNHEQQSSGYSPTDSLSFLRYLVESKQFKKAVILGEKMTFRSNESNLNLAYAYFELKQEDKALILLNNILNKEAVLFRTLNGARLLAAKGSYNRSDFKRFRHLLDLIINEKKTDPDFKFMGKTFWLQVSKLKKLTK